MRVRITGVNPRLDSIVDPSEEDQLRAETFTTSEEAAILDATNIVRHFEEYCSSDHTRTAYSRVRDWLETILGMLERKDDALSQDAIQLNNGWDSPSANTPAAPPRSLVTRGEGQHPTRQNHRRNRRAWAALDALAAPQDDLEGLHRKPALEPPKDSNHLLERLAQRPKQPPNSYVYRYTCTAACAATEHEVKLWRGHGTWVSQMAQADALCTQRLRQPRTRFGPAMPATTRTARAAQHAGRSDAGSVVTPQLKQRGHHELK